MCAQNYEKCASNEPFRTHTRIVAESATNTWTDRRNERREKKHTTHRRQRDMTKVKEKERAKPLHSIQMAQNEAIFVWFIYSIRSKRWARPSATTDENGRTAGRASHCRFWWLTFESAAVFFFWFSPLSPRRICCFDCLLFLHRVKCVHGRRTSALQEQKRKKAAANKRKKLSACIFFPKRRKSRRKPLRECDSKSTDVTQSVEWMFLTLRITFSSTFLFFSFFFSLYFFRLLFSVFVLTGVAWQPELMHLIYDAKENSRNVKYCVY